MAKTMTRQAARLIAVVAPFVKQRLAQDQSVDFRKLLGAVKADTFTEDKPRLLKGIQRLTQGKLAKDASIGEVAELLDLIDSHGVESDENVSAAQHKAMEATAKVNAPKLQEDKGKATKAQDNEGEKAMPGKHAGMHEFLKDKISAEDLDKVHQMLAGQADDAYDEAGHEEDDEVDKESEEFHGGEAEDEGSEEDFVGTSGTGEKLKSLGAETGEDEAEPEEEHEDNMHEWRRGEMKDRPATDRKHAKDKRHAKDARHAKDVRHAKDRKKARDNPPPFKGMPKTGGGMDRRGSAHDSRDVVTREEMENGIAAAVKVVMDKQQGQKMAYDKAIKEAQKVERDIREAERAVMPYVGALNMSFDSAEAVYAHTLRMLNIDVRGVHPSAYPSILRATRQTVLAGNRPRVAMDHARTKDYFERFPEARRIKVA